MGRHERARFNTVDAFSYKPDEILKQAKTSKLHLDARKLKRIKEVEMHHFISKYHRKGAKGLHDLPDFLKRFEEPPTMNDVKKLAKSILDDTYD